MRKRKPPMPEIAASGLFIALVFSLSGLEPAYSQQNHLEGLHKHLQRLHHMIHPAGHTEEHNPSQEEAVPGQTGSDQAQSNQGRPDGNGAQADSPDQSESSKAPQQTQGQSLFNIVENGAEILFLIILAASLPVCGTAALCAIVWHTGKLFRGGKKPEIG